MHTVVIDPIFPIHSSLAHIQHLVVLIICTFQSGLLFGPAQSMTVLEYTDRHFDKKHLSCGFIILASFTNILEKQPLGLHRSFI